MENIALAEPGAHLSIWALFMQASWVVKLRELPESPETYYLLELLASHDFQESFKNYFDLEELLNK